MLALGRALGETVAVYLIISPDYTIKFRPLEIGTITTSSLIANFFGDASNVAALRAARCRLRALHDDADRQHHRRDHRQSQPQRRGDGDLSRR